MTKPYSGGTSLGSGYISGPGYGNKTSGVVDDDTSGTRFGRADETSTYVGGTEYGSGMTAGAGAGNKTSEGYGEGGGGGDSTVGKLMEKAGGVLKQEGLAEKGREKRESAAGQVESTS